MKKLIFMLFILFIFIPATYACEQDKNFEFDRNYTFVENYRGTNYYIDNTSIVSLEYEPPFYKLAAGILIILPDETTSYRVYKWKYIYNTPEKRRMYYLTEDRSLSKYIPRYDEKSLDSSIIFLRPAGELAWEEFYKIPFYVK